MPRLLSSDDTSGGTPEQRQPAMLKKASRSSSTEKLNQTSSVNSDASPKHTPKPGTGGRNRSASQPEEPSALGRSSGKSGRRSSVSRRFNSGALDDGAGSSAQLSPGETKAPIEEAREVIQRLIRSSDLSQKDKRDLSVVLDILTHADADTMYSPVVENLFGNHGRASSSKTSVQTRRLSLVEMPGVRAGAAGAAGGMLDAASVAELAVQSVDAGASPDAAAAEAATASGLGAVDEDGQDNEIEDWFGETLSKPNAESRQSRSQTGPVSAADLKAHKIATTYVQKVADGAAAASGAAGKVVSVVQIDEAILGDPRLDANLHSWAFDPFDVDELTGGHSLVYTGFALIKSHGLIERLGLQPSAIVGFLSVIETGYLPNPYHNHKHATDVMQNMHWFIKEGGLWECMEPWEKLCALIAAAVHDFAHPARTNAFLMQTEDELATLYNNKSILENMHAARCMRIMKQDAFNVLQPLKETGKFEVARGLIIDLVLATDLADHFSIVKRFNVKVASDALQPESHAEDKLLLMQMAMKCSDVSNPAKPKALYDRWTAGIMQEFFEQGDEEKRRGLKVSAFMDRETTIVSKCQVGFIKFVVEPIYNALGKYLGPVRDTQLQLLAANLDDQDSQLADIEARAEADKAIKEADAEAAAAEA